MLQTPDHSDARQWGLARRAALKWATVLDAQVCRLMQTRQAAFDYQLRTTRTPGHVFTDVDNQPFWMIAGDTHLTMIAAAQLVRALDLLDGDTRLPADVDVHHVKILRNYLEHWEDSNGSAQRKVLALGIDADAHRWSHDGTGALGEVIPDGSLRTWALAVFEEVSGLREPDDTGPRPSADIA